MRQDPGRFLGSNVAAGQKEERPVLAAVGRLELVPEAELPLVLQLQSDDGLTQGASVLADHTEGGACGQEKYISFFPTSKLRPLVIMCRKTNYVLRAKT